LYLSLPSFCCCSCFFESIRHGFLMGCFHEKKIPSLYHGLGLDRTEGLNLWIIRFINDLCWPMILNKGNRNSPELSSYQ
jgi:hypothetical protein